MPAVGEAPWVEKLGDDSDVVRAGLATCEIVQDEKAPRVGLETVFPNSIFHHTLAAIRLSEWCRIRCTRC